MCWDVVVRLFETSARLDCILQLCTEDQQEFKIPGSNAVASEVRSFDICVLNRMFRDISLSQQCLFSAILFWIGVEGKYCLHFHKLHDCPTCLFKNNAIEGSHQRGIIIHSTHSSTVEGNVLYNVRGAGVYIEDGNEMYNKVNYNVVICPFPFRDGVLHGCTVPGTSNRIADTADNQAGIFTRAATNSLTGNRVSNSFNGMFLKEGSIGRGESYDKVCESAAKLGRYEGNTFHGNGRFGTYTLGERLPLQL